MTDVVAAIEPVLLTLTLQVGHVTSTEPPLMEPVLTRFAVLRSTALVAESAPVFVRVALQPVVVNVAESVAVTLLPNVIDAPLRVVVSATSVALSVPVTSMLPLAERSNVPPADEVVRSTDPESEM